MPRLQAVIQPLTAKNRLKSRIPQVNCTTAAQFFLFYFLYVRYNTPYSAAHLRAENKTEITAAARSHTHPTACK